MRTGGEGKKEEEVDKGVVDGVVEVDVGDATGEEEESKVLLLLLLVVVVMVVSDKAEKEGGDEEDSEGC